LVGLVRVLFCHCRVGDDSFVGDGVFEVFVGLVLRIVDGVWIVLLRIEVAVGLFGDRMDNGSAGLSIL
jgi:hypothetical protein